MSKLFKVFLAIFAIIIAIVGACAGYTTGQKSIVYKVEYEEYIDKYAYENDLNKYLVMAVIKQESNFIPDAHSGIAGGLMQLTEETAEWIAGRLGVESFDYMDPQTNIQFGCYYLRYLIDSCGDQDVALAAYNAGLGNVQSWLENPKYSSDGKTLNYIPFSETRNYVEKVKKYIEKYRELYDL